MDSSFGYRERIISEFLDQSNSRRQFEAYFKFYDQLMLDSDSFILQIDQLQPNQPHRISHEDVLKASQVIRRDPASTLESVATDLRSMLSITHSMPCIERTIAVAVSGMLMLDPAANNCHGKSFTIGRYRQVSWQMGEPLHAFVSRSFPMASVNSARVLSSLHDWRAMKAWKLKSRLGITFKGTNNLAQHLVLDGEHSILYLFHHASYLKAQLSRLKRDGCAKEAGISYCLQRGALPPRLLAETLHSLQSILFHWRDEQSSRILDHLIKKNNFDPDCRRSEGYTMFDDSIDDLGYLYWGERLATLHELMVNRPPRTRFEKWIKWQNSDSNAFAVALAALLISIIIGLLSLGLSAVQVWIAWRAWKDTVNN